jgi:hypothetical protein
MKRINLLILTLSLIQLISCKNGNHLFGSTELLTKPEKVKQGQVIEITLRGEHLPHDMLYAKVGSFNWDGNHSRYRLRFINEDGLLKAKFKVPDNSIFLKIDYEKKNEINNFEPLFKIVYEGDKPSLGGLVLSLRNTKDLDELNSLLKYNEELYPDNKLSWGMAYYLKRKRVGFNSSENEVDSVYKIVQANFISTSKEDLFDNLSSCFKGFCLEKNWQKAKSVLIEMKQKQFDNIIPSGLALDNLALFIRENSIASYVTIEAIHLTDETKDIFSELFSWKKIYNTGTFRATIIKRIDSVDANCNLLNPYIEDQTNYYIQAARLNVPNEFTDYYHITEIFKWRKEYSRAIEVGLKGKDMIGELLDTDIWDTTKIVDVMDPLDGLYTSLLLLVATCAELNKNDTLAISLYSQIINYTNKLYNNPDFIQGPKSLASIYLSKLYIRKYQFDKAKESLRKGYDFKSPFANSTFELLQKSLRQAGLDTLILYSYLHRSLDDLFPRANDFQVPSNRGAYNLNDSTNVLTFCFFLNGNCSVCDDPVFYAIDILNSYTNIEKNIVIFAKKEQFEFFKGLYKNVNFVEINKPILDKFQIKDLPYSLVVKSGRVQGINQNIPTNKNAWLYYLGILKSPEL